MSDEIVLDNGVQVKLSEHGKLKIVGLDRLDTEKAKQVYEFAKANKQRLISELTGKLNPSPQEALNRLLEILERDPKLFLCFEYEPQPAFTFQGVESPLWTKAFPLFVRAAPAIAERIPELKARYGSQRNDAKA